MAEENKEKIINNIIDMLINNSIDIPEFAKIIQDDFWKLIEE